MKTNAGNLKKGDWLSYQGGICQLQKAEFYSPGKGAALMKVRLKNVMTGKNIDYAFKSGEGVETLDVSSIELQYLYKDTELMYFMDERSYNQYTLPIGIVGDMVNFFKEGNKYFVFIYNDKALTVRPPLSVHLKVMSTEDAAKGDTVTGARKNAILETGVTVQVPLFVKQGEIIVVNPETGQYVERAKS